MRIQTGRAHRTATIAHRAIIGASSMLALVGTACSGSSDGDFTGQAENAIGVVYQVGPTRSYKTLGAVAGLLAPGDVVEVDGGVTYAGGVVLSKAGTASAKITVRGVPVGGKRPILSGGYNGIELAGNHTVLEGFEVTGSSARCIFHHANAITIRDTVVRDCPAHGILGADSDSGSLTLDHVEAYNCGAGTTKHCIYIATDEEAYPGSVFRMQHSYVHDTNGGNAVKTRAERNEIYYNWIEGGLYKELELIGPDGQAENLAREDSDVVGNVFKKVYTQYVVRVGGDGTGQTHGRYRFVNNTFLLAQGSAAAIHAFDGIESIEMHNNVFFRIGGGSVQILRNDGVWAGGSMILAGSKNAVPSGTSIPSGWQGTIVANDPGFVNLAGDDVSLKSGSALIDAGATAPASPSGHAFPSPLVTPAYLPPAGKLAPQMGVVPRPVSGAIDIGATEYGSGGSTPPPAPTPTTTTTTAPPPPSACLIGTPSAWLKTIMPSQSGVFTARWKVTPSQAPIDGAVALSYGAQSAWTGLAAIVRFNPNGLIDVRSGTTYKYDATIWYQAGKTYDVRMVVDVPAHKYSVYVTPPGGSEIALASQYGFRGEQTSVPALDHWTVNQVGSSGSLTACDFSVE